METLRAPPQSGSGTVDAGGVARPVRRARSIPSLTGIRGFAAGWVFLTHYQAVLAAYLASPGIGENRFLYNGFRGVDLFFVLSGFILMHVHGVEFQKLRAEEVRRFYLLRFFRVYPLNTAVLLVLLPLTVAAPDLVTWFRMANGVPLPFHGQDFSAAGFIQSLLLAQAWTIAKLGEWNGPAWSLSAEVFGYAVFPLLAHRLIRWVSPRRCVGLAGVSLVILMLLLVLGKHSDDSPTGTFGLIRMIFSFVAGMAMCRCFQLLPDRTSLAMPATLGSVVFIIVALAFRGANMLVVFGFCGLIFGLAYQRGPINAVLCSRLAIFSGKISFSFYLVHYIPVKMSLWILDRGLIGNGFALRLACVAMLPIFCVVLACITHRWLELPFQSCVRWLLRREPAPAGLIASI